jgi:hypothetical protein
MGSCRTLSPRRGAGASASACNEKLMQTTCSAWTAARAQTPLRACVRVVYYSPTVHWMGCCSCSGCEQRRVANEWHCGRLAGRCSSLHARAAPQQQHSHDHNYYTCA